MKKLAFLLLLAGLLLAPAYWIYAKFYTGSQALLVDLKTDPAPADGPLVWRSPVFELHPDMSPAGLLILADGHFAPNMDESRPPKDPYVATLFKGDEAAKPLGFTLGVSSVSDANPVFKEHLLLMQKVQPGQFHLEVVSQAPPGIVIDRMQLQVRQQLHEPDPQIVTAGIVSLVLGILLLVMG